MENGEPLSRLGFILRSRGRQFPTWTCGPHGRLGLDACAALCGGLRDAQYLADILVGLAASVGAGISMGFAEALSDDGSLTGRGSPWIRGTICGLMTALGGLGHSWPYLVPDACENAFWIATGIAGMVVFFDLWAIAYLLARFMNTRPSCRLCSRSCLAATSSLQPGS